MATTEAPPECKVSMSARSPEELFQLIEFCRAGKLKEVSEWIGDGKPIDPPQTSRRSKRRSPLQIAIEKGFFALAELLLDGGCDPMANGNALADAVSHRDVEIARLLLNRGVQAESVDSWSVFHGGAEIVKLFIEHGFDPTEDNAYFRGLRDNVHPLLFLLKGYKDRFPDLQQQAEMALCHYCDKENLRAVSLLLWAGARPDSEVPDPAHPDRDFRTDAFKEAVRSGNLGILKRLKPQDYPERLQTLLGDTWGHVTQPVIDYLLEAGAALNTKPNGGSKLLGHLLSNLDSRWPGAETSRESQISLIEHVARLGAKWIPGEDTNPRYLRDSFRTLSPEQIIRVFRSSKRLVPQQSSSSNWSWRPHLSGSA